MNDPPAPKRRRHWLTFSLRSLLVLTAVSGMFLGWFALKLQRSRQQEQAVAAILDSSGSVTYGNRLDDAGKAIEELNLYAPAWLRKSLGNDFFDNVIEVRLSKDIQLEQLPNLPSIQAVHLGCSKYYSDAGLVHLRELPHLRRLRFGAASHVTDAGLVHVGALTQLESLKMPYLHITDDGLRHLKGLAQLQSLTLGHSITDDGLVHLRAPLQLRTLKLFRSTITDAGLEHLAELTSLEELLIQGGHFTSGGLRHLESLPQLREVTFRNTDVAAESIARLQQALPGCEILR